MTDFFSYDIRSLPLPAVERKERGLKSRILLLLVISFFMRLSFLDFYLFLLSWKGEVRSGL